MGDTTLDEQKCERFVHDRKELTFFSDSIHLLIAWTEDPLRSFNSLIASLMISIVAIFGWMIGMEMI